MNDIRRGFTLIELLVVIAIIGLLAAIVLGAVNQSRGKARDAARRTTLKQLQTALELYREDNGQYPSTESEWRSSEPGDLWYVAEYIPSLAPTYISELPRDPLGGDSDISTGSCTTYNGGGPLKRAYMYKSNGTSYKLLSHCAVEESQFVSSDPLFDWSRQSWAWKVCSGEDNVCGVSGTLGW